MAPGLRFATTGPLATGPRLHYAEQGDAGGEPVVFLHGWPDSWFTYSRVLPLLPPRVRALVPDQRGFGDSDRPAGDYSIPTFAADVIAFLDALSIERATLVGHSFGSFVTRSAALSHPDRVSRIALAGTAVSAANPVTRDVQAAMQDLADPVPLAFVREFQASTACQPLPEAFFDRVVLESQKLPARLWRAVFDGILAYDDAAQLRDMRTPTLLLWGDRDALFPRADQDQLVATIPGAVLRVYPAIGHCPNWECPERVVADLLSFLDGGGQGRIVVPSA